MLTRLRASTGAPSRRTRVLALLIIAGMVLTTAPVILVPLARAAWHGLLHLI